MSIVLAISLGIALAAASGFRVFIPMLGVGIAALTGHLQLAPELAWIGSWPAVACFGVAALVEVAAYYIPWLDNILDQAALPLATAGGILLAAAVMAGELSPLLRWTLAVIAGGGAAAAVSGATSALRLASSGLSGGLLNHIIATLENIMSVAITLLVIISALAGLALVVLAVALTLGIRRRMRPAAS
jgi:hypothetical protein